MTRRRIRNTWLDDMVIADDVLSLINTICTTQFCLAHTTHLALNCDLYEKAIFSTMETSSGVFLFSSIRQLLAVDLSRDVQRALIGC